MTRVVRRTPGKERPRNAPMVTLDLRRAARRTSRVLVGYWHSLTIRLEARRGTTRPRKWRRWFSYTNVVRLIWAVGALVVLGWIVAGVHMLVSDKKTTVERWQQEPGFDALVRFIGPVLTASVAAALFLFWWYSWNKRRYLAKARKDPHKLVLTAGQQTTQIVGREELAQVIAQRLRERNTRRPYLLVGGVGTGKTAVLVRLTELLARERAVPVPIRLRDADGAADLNFERMAQQRFTEEAPQGVLARTKTERVWQQLLADDKLVVIADGLEEALQDDNLQQNRDNIIRRAIERAYEERLPVVIASRPHSPLDATPAAIVELEPLGEEEALHFVKDSVPETDERRVDWIVETAEVTESPVYLQIARELHQHGALERDRPTDDPKRLNTRSRDRSTLRLWLLDTWGSALQEGRLREDVALTPQERHDTLAVVSALACVGLLQDKLEVDFTELLGEDVHPSRARRARTQADHLWTRVRGPDRYGKHGDAFSEWHREQIWAALYAGLGDEESKRLHKGNMAQSHAVLARLVGNADKLGLLEGFEKRVRFPHSILQAYFGFRLLSRLEEADVGELIEQALQPPGPGRELLVAIVLMSRQRGAGRPARSDGVRGGVQKGKEDLLRRVPVLGRAPSERLCAAARQRPDDPKTLDLYAAALEVESVEADFRRLKAIVDSVSADWSGIKGDQRSVEDAKLRLLKQLGAALQEASDKKINTTPMYERLFQLGIAEPSYSVRLAVAQEFGNGGNEAFALIREWVGLDTDPIGEYKAKIRDMKAAKTEEFEAWTVRMGQARSALASDPVASSKSIRRLQDEREELNRRYEKDRVELLREFVMRAWMLPMLLGSVDDSHRGEAGERLTKWLLHLDPARTGGVPDLPLPLETALAQGFKYAANRRQRHPHTDPGRRVDLIRQAETVLQQSRCWYTQLSLLQALCLWSLPDRVGHHERDGSLTARHYDDHDRTREPLPTVGGSTAVQTVQRWLAMAGTVNAPPGAGSDSPRRLLHPFVAEAGDLVALALETGQPERFLWIDEKGVADNIGSRTDHPGGYRKHNLWIPPSVGWSTLDGRAQRLVADVLILLNLVERDGNPDEVEERMARVEQSGTPLPPCLREDRDPLRPGARVGAAVPPAPGTTCLPDCKFQLCPYPPRGVPRGEIREPFCRQQQALLPGRLRRWFPRTLRRKTPPWVSMRVRELDRFWHAMAARTRD
ncbi:NACHT domain-containing protein [Streptomyces venetus]|uniref:NACHT domain-containing protein n=1 Tax=Streptomyces venetus TaxID=1701086 RepID=UPI003C2D61F1